MSIITEFRHLWRFRKWLKEGGISKLNAEKLKSRKLWAMIIGSVALTLLSAADAPPDIISTLKWVLITYLGVQGAVDLTAKKNGG